MPTAKLEVELLFVVLELGHVLVNVGSNDSFSVNLVAFSGSISFLLVSRVFLDSVGDIESSITSSLQHTKDSGSVGSGLESNIEDTLEWSSVSDILSGIIVGSINLLDSFIGVVEVNLLQQSSGEKKTGGIGRGIVGESGGETKSPEFLRIGGTEDSVSLDGRGNNLGNDSGAGDSGNQSVLGSVVFVLILENESLSSVVVSLSLSSPLEFSLIPHEVGLVLDNFHECH